MTLCLIVRRTETGKSTLENCIAANCLHLCMGVGAIYCVCVCVCERVEAARVGGKKRYEAGASGIPVRVCGLQGEPALTLLHGAPKCLPSLLRIFLFLSLFPCLTVTHFRIFSVLLLLLFFRFFGLAVITSFFSFCLFISFYYHYFSLFLVLCIPDDFAKLFASYCSFFAV